MNIRSKLALRFTAIVATILTVFCIGVYSLSEDYRREEFFSRLESRGLTTARLFLTVKEVDKDLLRIIDKNSIYALYQEKVLVFDGRDSLVYTSLDDLDVGYSPDLLQLIRTRGKLEYVDDEIEYVGLTYQGQQGEFVVISSAFDRYGRSKLKNLRDVLLAGFLIGVLLIIVSGYIFAGQALQPLARINEEISDIGEDNLNRRVSEGNKRDEIAQLGKNFNNMLHRLETAFGVQQQFVSSASHELRNPLAAITGQLQMMLEKRRSPEEYERTLQSILEDTQTLVSLTNGLLLLAQSQLDKQRLLFSFVRVDEVLFAAQNELLKAQPGYHFLFEYDALPEDDSLLSINGNEQLLKTAFLNFMDNACKFSPDHTVNIRIGVSPDTVTIHFSNKGVGISPEEQTLIFTPFFRGKYATSAVPGHGIGLAICHRIIQLHNGKIIVHSEKGKGSEFIVSIPMG
ncbi:MAG: HAMP domain-containing sensor histidine kinase [Saprospiraceae bacterium]|nr:HAMP domain-containing sensor histidine kinase [Saprospiraceae bacterium]